MAYNLQPLITILQQILDPEQTRWILGHEKPQLESLLEKAVSLQQILEKSSVTTKIEGLESQIRDAAHKAEDIIESNMADQMLSKLGLPQLSQELDSVMKFIKGKTASSSSCGASSSHDVQQVESLELVEGMKKDLVGADADLMQLKERLTNIIESYIKDRTFSTLRSVPFTFSTVDLQQVMQQLDSTKEQVVKLKEGKTMSKGTSSSSYASFSKEVEALKLVEGKKMAVISKKDLVGVDADLMQLKDRLTNMQGKLEVIPIVGMGGIGKSALALSLYDDPLIVSRFDYSGWAAISQVHNMRSILLSLLRNPNGKLSDELIGLEESELKEVLYKRLFGRRYLVVLDDVCFFTD